MVEWLIDYDLVIYYLLFTISIVNGSMAKWFDGFTFSLDCGQIPLLQRG